MDWFVMAAGIPQGTQVIAVSAPTQGDAIRHAIGEVRKLYDLPKSHTIMPRVLNRVSSEEEAQEFINRLHEVIEKENNESSSS